jgi:hypothetical protein
MNILVLYESSQTFTNTIYEHVSSFATYSKHRVFYAHANQNTEFNVDLGLFDAIGIHYSIRLPFDQISPSTAYAFENFNGLKFLFIQDEYDFTKRTWYWIRKLGFQLIFTVVPDDGIKSVYPQTEFPNTRFVTNLTGYVPERLHFTTELSRPSERAILVGYRARPLPVRYGQLGIEKIAIGQTVKAYCDKHGLINDIAWTEEARIYGPKWYAFVSSCKSMLGSESGSNVFDWEGNLNEIIRQCRSEKPNISDQEIYANIVRVKEAEGLMNQVSPRIFEAIASRTILVLYEGTYSGVVRPGDHFIVLKKDGSNLAEVVRLLQDGAFVDGMTDRAFEEVIASGKYSYSAFISMVDKEWDKAFASLGNFNRSSVIISDTPLTAITTCPIFANPPRLPTDTLFNTFSGAIGASDLVKRSVYYLWGKLPDSFRRIFKSVLKLYLGKG